MPDFALKEISFVRLFSVNSPIVRTKRMIELLNILTMNYKLVILDFDGTIADTRRTIVRTLQMTMKELCLPVASEYDCAATIGLPLVECFLMLFPSMSSEQARKCCETYRRIFIENKKSLIPEMFPGVKDTLLTLASMGIALTVASSRSNASLLDFLGGFGLGNVITYVLGADDVAKAKPDPEPVLKTMADLGFSPAQTLVVGDMPYDILMGKGAGAAACGVSYGNSSRAELEASGADFVIDSFPELLNF